MSSEKFQTILTNHWERIASLSCGLIAALVYVGTVRFRFVYDDVGQIVDNPAIRSWRFLNQYFTSHIWAGILPFSSYYRPLDLVWFRFNYAAFGLNPYGWHVTSIVAHGVATVFVFYLVLRLLCDRRLAAVSALIFGLHPIHVQSVTWISGTADPLLAIFVSGAFIAYLRFRESQRIRWLFGSWFLYICAMLTKEPGVILPALVFAQEMATPTGKIAAQNWRARLTYAAKSAALFIAATVAYMLARLHALRDFDPSRPSVGLGEMVRTWPLVLWTYLKHLVLPWGYSLYYDLPPVQHITSGAFWIPLTVLAVTVVLITIATVTFQLDRRVVLTAAIWFLIPLLPSLDLRALEPQIFGQDRYLYLSSLGFAIFCAACILNIPHLGSLNVKVDRLPQYAAVIVSLILAGCTLTQQQYWVSNVALYRRALNISPENTHARNNLAVALAEANEFESAVSLFEQDLQKDPNSPRLNFNYGYTLYRMGEYKRSLKFLAQAIQLDPSMGEAFLYMGMDHLKLGYWQDAALEIRQTLALEPQRKGAHLALAAALEAQGDRAGAIAETRIEADNFPDNPLIRQRLTYLEEHSN